MSHDRYILSIESSCDETACALVTRDGRVLVNAIASQIDLHARYGGVVPEEASRRHIEACLPMVQETLARTKNGWADIEAIAVTRGPGLIGCLLVGVETAKALAWGYGKPLIGVHHLQGHLHAPFLCPDPRADGTIPTHLLIENGSERPALPPCAAALKPPADVVIAQPDFPHVGLIVSGGHTSLVAVESPGRCKTLASTRDDAAGEAYDKVARLLGIGFPGGPIIDKRATLGRVERFRFTPPMKRRDERDFSFSGLKSQVSRKVEELRSAGELDEATINDLCAGFQATVIESLLEKSIEAARDYDVRDLLIVGGVAANRGLRAAAARMAPNLRIWFPNFSLCTDNAAMIGGLAWHVAPLSPREAIELDAKANLPIEFQNVKDVS